MGAIGVPTTPRMTFSESTPNNDSAFSRAVAMKKSKNKLNQANYCVYRLLTSRTHIADLNCVGIASAACFHVRRRSILAYKLIPYIGT